jgi:hypothetical protein
MDAMPDSTLFNSVYMYMCVRTYEHVRSFFNERVYLAVDACLEIRVLVLSSSFLPCTSQEGTRPSWF